jgi:hypothetical protein
MSRRSELLYAMMAMLASVALFCAVGEFILRFLPTFSGLRVAPVTSASPVFHFVPNHDFVYSRDWDMVMVNHGHINNAGFVNNQDYRPQTGPLLAVVGDSYIEALMVPYGETVHGRLAQALQDKLPVYSFAVSGAPLSQYLIWGQHAVRDWGAKAVVINVVGNDFDESLANYGKRPGFWYYVPGANGEQRLRLSEYQPSILRNLVYASAFARYVIYNLRIGAAWTDFKALVFGGPAMAAPHYAGNTLAQASEARVKDSLAALDAFFRDLPDLVGLPPDRVAFTLDGFRYPAVAAAEAGSYFEVMRGAFRAKAEALGYEVLDLDPAFFARHEQTGEQFNYERDGHWNPAGHAVAFRAIMTSRFFGNLVH